MVKCFYVAKWLKVAKCGEKLEKVVESGGKWGKVDIKVAQSGSNWLKVVKSCEKVLRSG